ncbi:MAG: hypothetical protein ACTSYD_04895 [Candidatus Heimdallarchaeaceae archaeon]
MSENLDIQSVIQECRKVIAESSIEAGIQLIEKYAISFEKQNKFFESIILWQFIADSAKNLEETDALSYAYSKLITRYLITDNIEKAEEIARRCKNEDIHSAHLDLALAILSHRTSSPSNREIAEIYEKDIFDDNIPVIASPSVTFNSLVEIKRYVTNNLPPGRYFVRVYNYQLNTIEELEVVSAKLIEHEVISISELVEVN